MIRVDSFHDLVYKCAYKCLSQRKRFIRSKSLELLNAGRYSLLIECKRSKLQFQIWRFPVKKPLVFGFRTNLQIKQFLIH